MTVTLNADQEAAVETALQIVKQAGHMSLIGPAGTGKTTTIRVIAERVISAANGKGVLLLAPTHKARRQFEAAALPRGTRTMTIQKFCKVKPQQWRDQERFRLTSGNDTSTIDGIASKFALVIVDEASMISGELAAKALDLCQQAKVGLVFAGDPYQLPPVAEHSGDDDDGHDADVSKGEQAREFTHAPVIARLTKVMRHGGPILDFATGMRDTWERLHGFPALSQHADESQIEVLQDTQGAFIEHFSAVFSMLQSGEISESDFYRLSPRALCYTNRAVAGLTQRLRSQIYGPKSAEGWQDGEIILFPSYTTAASGALIYSSTDAIVLSSRIIEANTSVRPIHWKTPARKQDRVCELDFSGRFQELTVHVVKPDGTVDESEEHVVCTPLLNDTSAKELYEQLRKRVLGVSPRVDSKHYAWQWLSGIKKTYLTPVTSAFVLTVHKSQGSTFDHVYVGRDLLMAQDRATRNPLLYVAATRAAKSITFGAVNGVSA